MQEEIGSYRIVRVVDGKLHPDRHATRSEAEKSLGALKEREGGLGHFIVRIEFYSPPTVAPEHAHL